MPCPSPTLGGVWGEAEGSGPATGSGCSQGSAVAPSGSGAPCSLAALGAEVPHVRPPPCLSEECTPSHRVLRTAPCSSPCFCYLPAAQAASPSALFFPGNGITVRCSGQKPAICP